MKAEIGQVQAIFLSSLASHSSESLKKAVGCLGSSPKIFAQHQGKHNFDGWFLWEGHQRGIGFGGRQGIGDYSFYPETQKGILFRWACFCLSAVWASEYIIYLENNNNKKGRQDGLAGKGSCLMNGVHSLGPRGKRQELTPPNYYLVPICILWDANVCTCCNRHIQIHKCNKST